MRILLFQNVIPTYRAAMFRSLVRGSEDEVTVVSGRSSPDKLKLADDIFFDELNIRETPIRYWRLPNGQHASFQPGALSIARAMRPDAIVVQGGPYELTSWLLMLWGRLTGTPVIAWTIGLQRRETGLKWRLRKFFFGRAKGLLLYGDYPARLLAESGIDARRMHVIYNSLDLAGQREAAARIDPADIAALRDDMGIGAATPVFIFIGRLVARKRLPVAIEAIGMLRTRGIDAHLLFIGDGADRARLEQISRDNGLADRIHFRGAIYDEQQIASHMAIAQAAIIPEAGLPIIHPMAYGVVPVISDDIERHGTEWEAVVERTTGCFFKDDDAVDLADCLARLVADPAETKRIGEAARKLAFERYGAEAHAGRIVEGVRKFAAA